MLPKRVTIREEGPRDGWQNIEASFIPTETKLDYIRRLVDAGLPKITVTSFVHPDWVPQLADAEEVVSKLEPREGVSYGVLVPNAKGLQRALSSLQDGAPIQEVCFVVSVSETHNRRNINRSVDQTLLELERPIKEAREAGLHVSGGLATVFGCSFEGHVPEENVARVARAYIEMGAQELVLGDTTGMANPVQVERVLTALKESVPETQLTPHFHNTRGAAMANIYAALRLGVDSFESAFGELGGCQFAKGATGNVATEDVVAMLHEMGVQTGVDLDALIGVARDFGDFLGQPLDSHLVTAGPIRWDAELSVGGEA